MGRKPTAIVRAYPGKDQLTEAFISSQDVRASSKSLYKRTLNQFFSWVERKGYSLRDLTRVEILRYKDDLLTSGMSPLTVGSYLTAVRRLYEWVEANRLGPNIAKGIKTPQKKQQFKKQPLSEIQGRGLLSHFQDIGGRDYAIINLILHTGLRTIEVIRGNVEDITHKGEKRVLMVHGKGRDEKDNFVILTPNTYKPIEAYLRSRGRVKTGEPLFISRSNNNKGGRLTTRAVSRIAKEGLKDIGLNSREFTAHSLRHTTAVNILRAGGTLEDAQNVLRHTNPSTTMIYTATIKEEIRLQRAPEELLDSIYQD
jgi:integrase/recombinase XerC/integrase/recombinase XerD